MLVRSIQYLEKKFFEDPSALFLHVIHEIDWNDLITSWKKKLQ